MIAAAPDNRSPERRALDEQIAAEPPLAPPALPPGLVPQPVEAYLDRGRRIETTEVRPTDS
jgi:hypothetical protein